MKRELKFLDPSVYISWIFRKTLGHLPYFRTYAPGIKDIGDSDAVVMRMIEDLVRNCAAEGRVATFLDFGARDGARKNFARNCAYTGADIAPRDPEIRTADICACPQIPDESYDIVFSFDVLEHVERPWDAASECVRITKKGGLIICRTLFRVPLSPGTERFLAVLLAVSGTPVCRRRQGRNLGIRL